MPVAVALAVVTFAIPYLKNLELNFIREGFWLGILWLVMSIAIDMLLFSWGPMKMSITDYMKDIGVTYLMMPVITTGMGWIEQVNFKKLMKLVPPAR